MTSMRRVAAVGAACVLCVAGVAASSQKADKDGKDAGGRPKVVLRAQPVIAMSPARVVLTAELQGGPNDFEDYYCPTVAWDWGDGTESESTIDCEPYEPGKSEIKRRYTVEHVFRTGTWKVAFRLKQREKAVTTATVNIQVRPGLTGE